MYIEQKRKKKSEGKLPPGEERRAPPHQPLTFLATKENPTISGLKPSKWTAATGYLNVATAKSKKKKRRNGQGKRRRGGAFTREPFQQSPNPSLPSLECPQHRPTENHRQHGHPRRKKTKRNPTASTYRIRPHPYVQKIPLTTVESHPWSSM